MNHTPGGNATHGINHTHNMNHFSQWILQPVCILTLQDLRLVQAKFFFAMKKQTWRGFSAESLESFWGGLEESEVKVMSKAAWCFASSLLRMTP